VNLRFFGDARFDDGRDIEQGVLFPRAPHGLEPMGSPVRIMSIMSIISGRERNGRKSGEIGRLGEAHDLGRQLQVGLARERAFSGISGAVQAVVVR